MSSTRDDRQQAQDNEQGTMQIPFSDYLKLTECYFWNYIYSLCVKVKRARDKFEKNRRKDQDQYPYLGLTDEEKDDLIYSFQINLNQNRIPDEVKSKIMNPRYSSAVHSYTFNLVMLKYSIYAPSFDVISMAMGSLIFDIFKVDKRLEKNSERNNNINYAVVKILQNLFFPAIEKRYVEDEDAGDDEKEIVIHSDLQELIKYISIYQKQKRHDPSDLQGKKINYNKFFKGLKGPGRKLDEVYNFIKFLNTLSLTNSGIGPQRDSINIGLKYRHDKFKNNESLFVAGNRVNDRYETNDNYGQSDFAFENKYFTVFKLLQDQVNNINNRDQPSCVKCTVINNYNEVKDYYEQFDTKVIQVISEYFLQFQVSDLYSLYKKIEKKTKINPVIKEITSSLYVINLNEGKYDDDGLDFNYCLKDVLTEASLLYQKITGTYIGIASDIDELPLTPILQLINDIPSVYRRNLNYVMGSFYQIQQIMNDYTFYNGHLSDFENIMEDFYDDMPGTHFVDKFFYYYTQDIPFTSLKPILLPGGRESAKHQFLRLKAYYNFRFYFLDFILRILRLLLWSIQNIKEYNEKIQEKLNIRRYKLENAVTRSNNIFFLSDPELCLQNYTGVKGITFPHESITDPQNKTKLGKNKWQSYAYHVNLIKILNIIELYSLDFYRYINTIGNKYVREFYLIYTKEILYYYENLFDKDEDYTKVDREDMLKRIIRTIYNKNYNHGEDSVGDCEFNTHIRYLMDKIVKFTALNKEKNKARAEYYEYAFQTHFRAEIHERQPISLSQITDDIKDHFVDGDDPLEFMKRPVIYSQKLREFYDTNFDNIRTTLIDFMQQNTDIQIISQEIFIEAIKQIYSQNYTTEQININIYPPVPDDSPYFPEAPPLINSFLLDFCISFLEELKNLCESFLMYSVEDQELIVKSSDIKRYFQSTSTRSKLLIVTKYIQKYRLNLLTLPDEFFKNLANNPLLRNEFINERYSWREWNTLTRNKKYPINGTEFIQMITDVAMTEYKIRYHAQFDVRGQRLAYDQCQYLLIVIIQNLMESELGIPKIDESKILKTISNHYPKFEEEIYHALLLIHKNLYLFFQVHYNAIQYVETQMLNEDERASWRITYHTFFKYVRAWVSGDSHSEVVFDRDDIAAYTMSPVDGGYSLTTYKNLENYLFEHFYKELYPNALNSISDYDIRCYIKKYLLTVPNVNNRQLILDVDQLIKSTTREYLNESLPVLGLDDYVNEVREEQRKTGNMEKNIIEGLESIIRKKVGALNPIYFKDNMAQFRYEDYMSLLSKRLKTSINDLKRNFSRPQFKQTIITILDQLKEEFEAAKVEIRDLQKVVQKQKKSKQKEILSIEDINTLQASFLRLVEQDKESMLIDEDARNSFLQAEFNLENPEDPRNISYHEMLLFYVTDYFNLDYAIVWNYRNDQEALLKLLDEARKQS